MIYVLQRFKIIRTPVPDVRNVKEDFGKKRMGVKSVTQVTWTLALVHATNVLPPGLRKTTI